MLSCYIETSHGVATRRPCPTRCVVAILKAEAKGRNWGELLGRDWRDDWQAMLGGANRLLFDHEKAVWPTGRLRTVLRLG